MNSDMEQALELYRSLSALQPKYKELYTDLEKQYLSCQCYACKIRLISFGMELINLNTNVKYLEAQLLPTITGIMDKLGIRYSIHNGHIIILET